jgi:type II secretory ATPase GspE/PulE/Tfp pilus assembly ATPase PilB-like protein
VSTYPTVTGEKVVLRLFTMSGVKRLDALEFDPGTRAALAGFLRRPAGLLLLTGPAGSGKTTTIYACLLELAEAGGRHIITVEDPVEQVLPGVMQTEVCEARGLNFATAARHLLRQDPQVLAIGEIRDEETAAIAVRSALTGHLVISTLHAGSCAGVMERLMVLCRDHSAVAAAVDLVLNQRLVRCVCGGCRGEGCAACAGTGYRGRRPLAEWVQLDDAARAALRAGRVAVKPAQALEAAGRQLVSGGVSDAAELRRVLGL